MIRLLFIPLFALVLFSCDDSSEKFDPLFYQISEADSARCMNEILEGILDEGQEWQIQRAIAMSKITVPICFPPEQFDIWINSNRQLMVEGDFADDLSQITPGVFNFYFINRNLKRDEIASASVDTDYPGWLSPFYSQWNIKELEDRITRINTDIEEYKTDSVDVELMEYFENEIEEIELKISFIEYAGCKSIPQVTSGANVEISYQDSSALSNEAIERVAIAFYHLRNYECLRYFNESYLNLYERLQRTKQQIDSDKIRILEILHQATIILRNREFLKRNEIFMLGIEAPPIPQKQ
ncbi:MAG: hypothetical protein P8P74_05965 [Crocinitomicaceae bacterium]|nr:hypothetical protein [Crocinitomicaceae bacterium]